jgi:hypothetical protein
VIGKISKGASGRGLVRYLFGPGKANEHTDQRVIASGVSLWAEEGRMLTAREIADLGASLDSSNDSYGKNPSGGHIWHASLSLAAGERVMTDQQWAEIAQMVMSTMGFEREGLERTAWVAIGHGVSAQGNQHIHIAGSIVRNDGSVVKIWQDRRTLSRVCAEVEHTYGLTVVEGREGRGLPGLTRAELERTAREQWAEPPRITLARIVREASFASIDEAEFVRRLRESGALARPRFETGGREAVVGYSVALRTGDGDTPIWFGGGKLARDLTLPNLRQLWELSAADQKAAVAEWIATKSNVPGREAMLGMADDWQRAAASVERAVEKLRVIPVSDLAAWRGAARETSGVFAAWSRRCEGDSPGPLADSADALARSAQYRSGDPASCRAAVRDFRGIAAVVAQSELNSDSPMAWAMLLDQLGRTLRAISDAHAIRGETEMARALVGSLSMELEVLHDQFETSSIGELVPEAQTFEERVAEWWPDGVGIGLDIEDDLDLDLDLDHDVEFGL